MVFMFDRFKEYWWPKYRNTTEKEEFERIFALMRAIDDRYNENNDRNIQTSYMPDVEESDWVESQGKLFLPLFYIFFRSSLEITSNLIFCTF